MQENNLSVSFHKSAQINKINLYEVYHYSQFLSWQSSVWNILAEDTIAISFFYALYIQNAN